MKLIYELNKELIYEAIKSEDGIKKWTFSGVTLSSEIFNKNKRKYPKKILSEAITKHCDEFMEDGRAVGELNHPEGKVSSINLDRVSHKFIEVKEDGNDFITKAEVLDTPTGKITQSLLEGGVKLGISSRGLGKLKPVTDGVLVESLYLISLGDLVSDPSAPKGFVKGVLEGIEFELNADGVIEKKIIDARVDKYNKILSGASKTEINSAISTIMADYISMLGK